MRISDWSSDVCSSDLVHDLADLLGVRLRERAAEHREVLAEHEDQPPVDGAVASHHAVAGDFLLLHAEVEAAVLDIHVPLLEGALVEQDLQALARGQLALGVMRDRKSVRVGKECSERVDLGGRRIMKKKKREA